MDNIILEWSKDLSQAPNSLILIKIKIADQDNEIVGHEMALAYQTDGIKGDFYVYLPNNGTYTIDAESISEWSEFKINS